MTFIGLNNSIGWIPGVGTAVNGVKFGIDVLSLAGALVTFNAVQVINELGNIVADTIGLVPVIGGPVASLISQTVLGGNIKMGILVQQSLQSFLDVDSTWSKYQFQVDSVAVPTTLSTSYTGTATVSKPNYSGNRGVMMDITNTGFSNSWSVPLEGRVALLSLAFATDS